MEMGHVFKLGTLYSEVMGVHYLGEDGERRPAVMGCYGIGVERLLAAVIEANHDANGIVWPASVAPFAVHVVVLNGDQPQVVEALEAVEGRLRQAGVDVLVDDRDESAGIKFKDADLLGAPVRLTISPRALERGGIEVRRRRSGETAVVALDALIAAVGDGLG
jgi:prolyl-tRNA synthetase